MLPDPSQWSLGAAALTLAAGAALIAWTGSRLAGTADRLADRTGLGEAVTGSVFLGLTTALPGLAASITAALDGRPALAIANALGGIAVQTTFLAVADLVHARANLEHAAASLANMIQTAVLVTLLALVGLGLTGPDVTLGHVHPMTPVLFLVAGAGFVLVYRSSEEPMWRPKSTAETVPDVPDEAAERTSLWRLVLSLVLSGVVVALAGVMVARASGAVADHTGISETVAGGLFSGVATSLPELMTTVAAVRRGALTLAVSDIVGGNFFDVLFIFAADLVYLGGSIYHAPGVGDREVFLAGQALLLNIVLLLGLLYRQREGPANIGFESVVMLVVYLGGYLVLGLLM